MSDYDPSAKRIKNLVEKKSDPPISPHKKNEKNRNYQKTLSVKKNINNFSGEKNSSRKLKKAHVLSGKEGKIPLEQLFCSINQNYPLFFLKKMGKIKSLPYKEKLIAIRNLKNFTHEMQKWICANIQQEVKVYKEKEESWRDLLEKREERHFQIDRIIKYLSEI